MNKSSFDSQTSARHLGATFAAPLAPSPQGALFEMAPDSECSDLLITASQLASFDPGILAGIERDLNAHAIEKKRIRWEHRRWIEDQSQELIDLPMEDMSMLKLEAGRPRMHPLAVLGFLFLRGWLGGAKHSRFEVILRESISLRIFLHNLNQSLPGGSTIEENLNALSDATRERIHKAQLALALEEGLDDFAGLRIDSTHCASASAYPTDSGTLTKLVCRLCARMQNLKPIDLPALAGDQLDMLEEARKETQVLNYRICTLTSSSALQAEKAEQEERERLRGEHGASECDAAPESPQTPEKQAPDASDEPRKESPKTRLRRELYQELYAMSLVTVEMLVPMLSLVTEQMSQSQSNPQTQGRREAWLAAVEEDLQAVAAVIEQSQRRVCEGKKPGAKTGMPLSVSDPSASFIEKGGWERVFGYRPQCGFSGNGLITALLIPEGNVSDQIQLWAVVNKSIENTTVIPRSVTVDDGYTGASELIKVKDAGVEVVSFSGARGRVLLGEETWKDERYVQARRDRNGAESGISVLKEKVEFGQLSRTGIEAVRAEQLEKVLTVNALKIVELRKRQYEKEQRASWSQGMVGKGKREVA